MKHCETGKAITVYDVDAVQVTVIRVQFSRGSGTREDVYRKVTAYFDTDGSLLAESDPCKGGNGITTLGPESPTGEPNEALQDV